MNFKYRKYPLDPLKNPNFKKKSSIRPVIQIDFETKSGGFGYLVLLDSGADYCVFHAEIGEKLGLDVVKGDELTFLGHLVSHKKHIFITLYLK